MCSIIFPKDSYAKIITLTSWLMFWIILPKETLSMIICSYEHLDLKCHR